MGHLQLPEGKRIAVNLGTDFDAQCLWLGAFNRPTPAFMSRGEFGAEVGVPRLLELYGRMTSAPPGSPRATLWRPSRSGV